MKLKINILQTSFIISLLGIFLLLVLSGFLQPKSINIEDITLKQLNKQVRISGQITNIKSYKDSSFRIITLNDKTESVPITTNQILDLSKNQTITVIGKITEYEGDLQIQANKIIFSP